MAVKNIKRTTTVKGFVKLADGTKLRKFFRTKRSAMEWVNNKRDEYLPSQIHAWGIE